ncbi:MAG: TIGR04211 family SH3 domain-containing protein [Oleiphilus sp.]|nr:MAG: TIGR04211 family SH3 domain-containing protein [Oleiphilus sp.]
MIARLIFSLFLFVSASNAGAQTAYIDDTLLVPLRSGPGTSFRIIHKGIKSGLKLEVLEKNPDTGYSFVRTPGGLEGYLPTRYLSNEPIAKVKLAQANEQLRQVTEENKSLKTKLNTVQKELDALSKTHQQTSAVLEKNVQELGHIKNISANAVNLDLKNRELRESNEQLRNELELLQVENIRLKDRSESNMMLMGGGLVTLGVILALLIPLLKPSKKNDSWA